MRELVRTLAARLVEFGGTGDPFTLWRPLEAELPAVLDEAARHLRIDAIPPLAGLLALGAIDNALHDAWSRTAGRSPYEMYTREHMNQDLGWVMPELRSEERRVGKGCRARGRREEYRGEEGAV